MRAYHQKTLRDKPFGEHCQSLLSQHWGEIREGEVATEDEIERPWGRLRPQVLFQKYHDTADGCRTAIRFARMLAQPVPAEPRASSSGRSSRREHGRGAPRRRRTP